MKLAVAGVRRILINKYLAKKRLDPHYRYKDYARLLNTHPQSFSQFIHGKRSLSKKKAEEFLRRVSCSPYQIKKALCLYDVEKTSHKVLGDPRRLERLSEIKSSSILSHAERHFLSDPMVIACFYALEIEGGQSHHRWIEENLGLSAGECSEIFETLQRLGLVQKVEGRFIQTQIRLRSWASVDKALRLEYLKRTSTLLFRALDFEYENCIFQHVTCAINSSDIGRFRGEFRKFILKFNRMQRASEPKRVYKFMLGLFPIGRPT